MLHNTFQYILNLIYIGQINNFKVQSLYKRLILVVYEIKIFKKNNTT